MRLYGESIVTDDYNGNKHYERIGDWKVASDTIVWGLKNLEVGTLNIEVFAGISSSENGSSISIFLDTQEQVLTVSSTSTLQAFQSQGTVNFTVNNSGTHEVKIKILTQNSNDNFGEVQKLILTGNSLTGASIWKRRWRPAAIHCKFMSNNDADTEITVYEQTILTS